MTRFIILNFIIIFLISGCSVINEINDDSLNSVEDNELTIEEHLKSLEPTEHACYQKNMGLIRKHVIEGKLLEADDEAVELLISPLKNCCHNKNDAKSCNSYGFYSQIYKQRNEENKTYYSQYYKKSCGLGYRSGCKNFADILNEKDEKKALIYYKKACELGDFSTCIDKNLL